MKKTLTLINMILLLTLSTFCRLSAQINGESPFPAEFVVNSPSSIAGSYPYTSQVNSGAGGAWGPHLNQTVTGDLVWAYDTTGDSLACDPIVTDLTGKMALIRRGDCNFSLKVYNAEMQGAVGAVICNHYLTATDDANTLVNMQAADTAFTVTIPAVFLSRATCEAITAKLDAGIPVNVSFAVRSFSDPLHAYTYLTPQSEIIPLQDMGVTFTNLDTVVLPEVTLTIEITDPNNVTTTLTQVVSDLPALEATPVIFEDSYLPEAVGEYTVVYSNSANDETFTRKFEIGDYSYAQDNNDLIDWIAPSNMSFTDGGFMYDFGNFYRTGDSEQIATHVTFSLANPDSLYTADPEADKFEIRIYDADPDGNGVVPGDAQTYDALNESGGGEVIVGFADYMLTGEEEPYELLTVQLEDPVMLEPNKVYLVMVRYNGLEAGIGVPPWYVFGGAEPIAGGLGEAVFTDRLYVGGWNGDWKGVIRLHLEGFVTSGTVEPLDNSKMTVSPVPTSGNLQLEIDLDKQAEQVDIRIHDFTGRLVRTEQLENVKKGVFNFDVSKLPNGTYFFSVSTPEGFRSKKIVIMK